MTSAILLIGLKILLSATIIIIIITTSPAVAFRTSSKHNRLESISSSSFLAASRQATITKPLFFSIIISSTSTISTISIISASTISIISARNSNILLFSSIGDDNNGSSGRDGRGDDENNDLGDFLDPMKKPESEGMKRARQYMSETSLPISFDRIVGGESDENNVDEDDNDVESKDADLMTNEDENSMLTMKSLSSSSSSDTENIDSTEESSTSLVSTSDGNATSSALFGGTGSDDDSYDDKNNIVDDNNNGEDDDDEDGSQQITGPSPSLLAKNPFMEVVSKISPSDLIAKFTAESDPRVQEAVRTTILGLIGSLPKLAFETTNITTGQRLASLMFQLQMTGYMFKNAEYRLSMSQSLGMSQTITSNLLLTPGEELSDKDDDPLISGKIKGKLKIRYGKKEDSKKDKTIQTKTNTITEDSITEGMDEVDSSASSSSPDTTEDGMEIEVDAAAYMSELRAEVSKLRDELTETKEVKDEALRKDLLLYIRTLPAQELKSLTNTMSQDVLVCMKGLVQAVLAGIGDGKIGPDTVTEQSGEAMAQLCMWQLAVGYNLRELEVREEMNKNLKSLMGDRTEGGIDLSEPGTLE
eukprot:CAMPEP_0170968298 /NCGR_PEP_ID=MMETSP0735-20130129/43191_1 /TAXON_ID=186038 /ORGANISM="Fragilariopsis kerguelensis, Strain L26-C5" /LENGTH=588 /DNA_ID=CAMNT_0011387333 /DNA_START=76 /DNA_END=1842 /DNA_ORIENTATION=-